MSSENERKPRRVAVVVFGEVESGWDRDAENGLMLAVRQMFDRKMGLPRTIPGMGASGEFEATVHEVLPLSAALTDNYLKPPMPSGKAYGP